jgi:predicted acyltransferase
VIDDFWLSVRFLAVAGASIAFGVWGLRQKYELDIPMNRRGKPIRILLVLAGWFVAALPFPSSPIFRSIRGVAVVLGLALLCWPNIVVHVMRRLGRPVEVPEAQNEIA